MLKLMKYLKPFIVLVISAVILLFIQAMCDLALPDYMSNIVNVGIQQSGIENAVPKAVRESEMNRLLVFMNENDRQQILKNYTFVNKSSLNYSGYLKDYPGLESEPLYVLKNIDEPQIDRMNPVMGKAFLAVSGVEKIKDSARNGVINFNGQKIPANTDLFALFSKLPETQRLKISESMNKKFTSMGDSMIIQASSASIRDEYEKIGMNTDKIQSRYIVHMGVIMLLISLLGAVCTIAVGLIGARIAAGLSKNLRRDLFTKVESFSSEEFNRFSTASLITRTTNDITQIQLVVFLAVRMLIYAPILGVGGVLKVLSKSTSMTWIIALAVVILLGLIGSIFAVAFPKFKIVQKLVDKLNLITRENLSGMMVVRAFNTQKFEEKRFDRANQELTDTNLFINRVMSAMFPAMMLIMNGVTILIVWVGSHQIASSSMQVGDMMAFMQYAMQIIFAFLMMSFMFILIPRASVSAQRVNEVLEVKPSIVDPEKPLHFPDEVKGVIEFKNVSFRYEGAEKDVLKNISFKALPGQTTAFIGSTGSGKSTLVNLVPRFYDVTGGQIFIDGIDIRKVAQRELRDLIGYVPQKGALFKGTIESNLKYARDSASDSDMEEAARIAQAKEFIDEKPERFESEISQGGSNVSGGQKQRLSIARALVKRPKIYIFDDSFSALDFKTDSDLRKALKTETKSSTILIVAQRISTIKNAQQIVVLEKGEIVGVGTHGELMEKCETYREIALSQLSKEELA
ncbi:ABC transporter ATP-binding protein [Clostridium sp. MT-14]|uniref:ABC transporter ATP-binding protein n=1 Tax=Clostridium sp. MT-14 TaxID=3348360 RepID=UPI0035F3AA52